MYKGKIENQPIIKKYEYRGLFVTGLGFNTQKARITDDVVKYHINVDIYEQHTNFYVTTDMGIALQIPRYAGCIETITIKFNGKFKNIKHIIESKNWYSIRRSIRIKLIEKVDVSGISKDDYNILKQSIHTQLRFSKSQKAVISGIRRKKIESIRLKNKEYNQIRLVDIVNGIVMAGICCSFFYILIWMVCQYAKSF